METLLPQDLAKLSLSELEQLLEAVTRRSLRIHFQLRPDPVTTGKEALQ